MIAANVRQIELKEVLCYELSPIPFSLAHQDGSLRKTTKSTLAALIEAKVNVLHDSNLSHEIAFISSMAWL